MRPPSNNTNLIWINYNAMFCGHLSHCWHYHSVQHLLRTPVFDHTLICPFGDWFILFRMGEDVIHQSEHKKSGLCDVWVSQSILWLDMVGGVGGGVGGWGCAHTGGTL